MKSQTLLSIEEQERGLAKLAAIERKIDELVGKYFDIKSGGARRIVKKRDSISILSDSLPSSAVTVSFKNGHVLLRQGASEIEIIKSVALQAIRFFADGAIL